LASVRGELHLGRGEGFYSVITKVGPLGVWDNDAVSEVFTKFSITFPHKKKIKKKGVHGCTGRVGEGFLSKQPKEYQKYFYNRLTTNTCSLNN